MKFLILLFLSALVHATNYEIVEGEISSTLMKAKIPYRAMIPKNISGKIPVVYFLHGRGGNRFQFRDVDGEKIHQEKGKKFAVVSLTGTFQGHDSYWVDDVTDKRWPWREVVLKEMIPQIEEKHHLGGSRDLRMIAGISMGSHGAWQLALTTGEFRCVAGHSLVVRSFETMSEQFPGKFGTREQFEKRDPLFLLRQYQSRKEVPVKKLWADIGGEDSAHFVSQAKLVEAELLRLKTHSGDHLDIGVQDTAGRHDYPYWKKHMPEYVDWYAGCFEKILIPRK